jgi:phytoene dehydrogenase-like protein
LLSATVQYAPARLSEQSWPDLKPRLEERTLATLDALLPGLAATLVEAPASLTPDEIEARWGAPGGHWHHIDLGIDQSFLMRPVPGWAQYTTPIDGLLLCGAGSHPGGWVTGQPGANAARRALDLIKKGAGR